MLEKMAASKSDATNRGYSKVLPSLGQKSDRPAPKQTKVDALMTMMKC